MYLEATIGRIDHPKKSSQNIPSDVQDREEADNED